MYAPLRVNHLSNDEVLVEISRIVGYLKLLIKALKNKRWNSRQSLEEVMDSAEIFPTYHARMASWDYDYLKSPEVNTENCSEELDIRRGHLLADFVAREKRNLNRQMQTLGGKNHVFNFVIDEQPGSPFSERKLVKRKIQEGGILIDSQKGEINRGILADDLVDALAKVCTTLDGSRVMQREMLELMIGLVDEWNIEDAELLHRVYLMMTNYGLPSEHNKKKLIYEDWKKRRRDFLEMIATKKRAEIGLHRAPVISSPATAPAATETSSAEATSAEPAKPTGR